MTPARRVVERLEAELAKEQASVDEYVRDCRATGKPIGSNYWQRRHALEQKLSAARDVAKILEEDGL